ncbi:MAG TPA: hypothetical protein VIP11_10450 [Gemmatimonadaceae bacterium]
MKPLLTALVAIVLFACVLPTDACGCLPAIAGGTIAGFVQTANGAPAAGATVRVEMRRSTCDLSKPLVGNNIPIIRTDSAGRYLHYVYSGMSTDTVCLRLVAHAAGAPTGDSAVVDGVRMQWFNNRGDSTRVDLRLP